MSAKPPADARPLSDPVAPARADRADQPCLLFSDGDGRQQVFVFTPEMESATVGRRSSADLVLGWDAQVSRTHARFERVDDHWEVVDDQMSSNGTFVNDRCLSGRHRLHDGDILRFGTTTVRFRSPERAQPDAPDVPESRPRRVISLSSTQRRVLVALCRPGKGQGLAAPATDEQIAEDIVVSVAEVRAHLRVLYAKLGVDETSGERRVRLVERALSLGVIAAGDL